MQINVFFSRSLADTLITNKKNDASVRIIKSRFIPVLGIILAKQIDYR